MSSGSHRLFLLVWAIVARSIVGPGVLQLHIEVMASFGANDRIESPFYIHRLSPSHAHTKQPLCLCVGDKVLLCKIREPYEALRGYLVLRLCSLLFLKTAVKGQLYGPI